MPATLITTARGADVASGVRLHVDPRGIEFWDVGADLVRIEVRVANLGTTPSREEDMLIEAAPLGAFVPWKPLTRVAVPALAPGESVTVSTEARRPRPTPLGDFSDVPPERLLDRVWGAADRPAPRRSTVRRLRDLLLRSQPTLAPIEHDGLPELPPDPMDLLARGNFYWAGNLNVFVGYKAVERHLARALRIYPGRTNLALFCVGSGRDAYRFQLETNGQHWDAAIYDMSRARSLRIDRGQGRLVRFSEWVEVSRRAAFMVLAMCPPPDAVQAELSVHVTQRSTMKEAVVEFSLDARAAGPGCYAV